MNKSESYLIKSHNLTIQSIKLDIAYHYAEIKRLKFLLKQNENIINNISNGNFIDDVFNYSYLNI